MLCRVRFVVGHKGDLRMKTHSGLSWRSLTICGLCLASVGICAAQEKVHVTLNTSALQTATTGPYTLDFQFTDGSGTGDANNTIALSTFLFGSGGCASGTPTLAGGAAGSLASGFTLTDSSFFNEASQGFTPGT